HLSSQHTSSPSVLHSFPTRRSSDLDKLPKQNKYDDEKTDISEWTQEKFNQVVRSHQDLAMKDKIYVFSIFRKSDYKNIGYVDIRSEEHTSELQSRFDLVCRLLLEKK